MDNYAKFTGESVLCVEIERAKNSGTVRVVLSIPGRPGASARTWDANASGLLTEAQIDDIRASIDSSIFDWILLAGAQRQLWTDRSATS